MVNFGNAVFETCHQTDKQTYIHADHNTLHSYRGEVVTHWCHLFLINRQTSEERDVAALTPALSLRRQYRKSTR